MSPADSRPDHAAGPTRYKSLAQVTLDIAAAFEQLALWSKKEKMCASCYTERGTVEIGPTPYCHVQYFMCAPCAEHFQVAA